MSTFLDYYKVFLPIEENTAKVSLKKETFAAFSAKNILMNSFRNETAFTNDFGKEEALKCAKAFFKRKNHESKRLVIFGAGEGNRTLVFSLGS